MAEDPKQSPGLELDSSRRGFLGAAIGALGLGMAAGVAVPGARMLGYPLWSETTAGSDQVVPAGPLTLFEGDAPVKVELRADTTDAWNRRVQVKIGSAWVLRVDGELTALSTVCPHLGCGIDFVAEEQKFLCACHDSWFSLDGAVEEGPSPRGMDSLEVQVDEGSKLLQIRHQRFKQGVETKEPV